MARYNCKDFVDEVWAMIRGPRTSWINKLVSRKSLVQIEQRLITLVCAYDGGLSKNELSDSPKLSYSLAC